MSHTVREIVARGALALASVALASPLHADTLNVASDTFTNLSSVNQKNGTNADIIVRNTAGDRHGFVRFDISALPPGTNVARASLRLYATQVLNSGTLDIKPVLGAWDEATLSHATTPALGAVAHSHDFSSADEKDYVVIDVTSTVQQWVAGSLANNGFALTPNSGTVLRVTFDSKESPDTAHPIELEVIPVGPQGPQGPQGIQGPAGPQGPQGDPGAGSVVQVNTGTGLTGGPITTTGTISLDTAYTDGRYFQLNASNNVFGQQSFTNNAGASALVAYTTQANSAHAVLGHALSTTGTANGVVGASASSEGAGLVGLAEAASGATTGVLGRISSAQGTAGVFDNTPGGRMIEGFSGGASRFRVDGTAPWTVDVTGAIRANGTIEGETLMATANAQVAGTVTAAAFSGDGSALTNVNAVTANTAAVAGDVSCTGCITEAKLAFDPVTEAELGDVARLSQANLFTSDQTVNGRMTLTNTSGSEALTINSSLGSGLIVDVTHPNANASILGRHLATSGTTHGVLGHVESASGTGGIFSNGPGGAMIEGISNGVSRFRVNGTTPWTVDVTGALRANGTIEGETLMATANAQIAGSVTAATFVGDGSALTNIPAGPQGPQGIQGPAGPQGPEGPAGPAGTAYVRTVVVSPVVGDAAASGAALHNAMNSIASPSASNRWLLKLEPGVYDISAGGTLYGKPYVDIEGSGEGVTIVTKVGDGSFTVGTLRVADNSEIRRLTVENTGGNVSANAIVLVGTVNARLSHVTALADGGSTHTWGIVSWDGAAVIEDCTVRSTGTGSYIRGIQGTGYASSIVVRRTIASASSPGSISEVIAMIATYGSAEFENSDGSASGGLTTIGIMNEAAASFSVSGGTFRATGGTSVNYGAHSVGTNPIFHTIRTDSSGYGYYQSGGGAVRIVSSFIDGTLGLRVDAGTTSLSGGQIRNGVTGAGLKCAFVSNATFDPLTSACVP